MPILSDPAMELHNLCSALKDLKGQENVRDVLAKYLEVDVSSRDYYMALSIMAARFERLTSIYDEILDEPLKATAVQTLKVMQTFLSTGGQRTDWPKASERAFSVVNMQTLLMSSAFVRTKAPLYVPTDDEREQAVVDIDRAIDGLAGFDGSVSSALRASLVAARAFLLKFNVYGLDALSDELLRAFAVHKIGDLEVGAPADERRARSKAWAAVVVVAALFVGSDSAITAFENHYSRSHALMHFLATAPKLLPAPDLPQEEEPTQSGAVLPRAPRPDGDPDSDSES